MGYGDVGDIEDINPELDILTGGSGADTFVLGGFTVFYQEFNGQGFDPVTFNLDYVFYRTVVDDGSNVPATDDYATITDFRRSQGDKIQILGSKSNYTLVQTANVSGGSALDTQIFCQNDLIAIAQDTITISLNRDFISV